MIEAGICRMVEAVRIGPFDEFDRETAARADLAVD